MRFRSPCRVPSARRWREIWSEWQDLRVGPPIIDFAQQFYQGRRACVPRLCTRINVSDLHFHCATLNTAGGFIGWEHHCVAYRRIGPRLSENVAAMVAKLEQREVHWQFLLCPADGPNPCRRLSDYLQRIRRSLPRSCKGVRWCAARTGIGRFSSSLVDLLRIDCPC